MSLRPEISGFDLVKFLSLFGSRDAALIKAIEIEFSRYVAKYPTQYTSEFRKTFGEALRQAVLLGIPFPGLLAETGPHFVLATLMAVHDQEMVVTDSNYWDISGFSRAWESGGLFIPVEQDTGITQILFGRPLFGEDFETEWSLYGYLSRDELRYMRSRLLPAAPDGPDAELVSQLLDD